MMAVFQYEALDVLRRKITGRLEAPGHVELAEKLEKQGLYLVSWKYQGVDLKQNIVVQEQEKQLKPEEKKQPEALKEKKAPSLSFRAPRAGFFQRFRVKSISPYQLSLATRQLLFCLKSGIVLNDALLQVATQSDNIRLSGVFFELSARISSGRTFSESLADFPDVFSAVYVNIVKVGETGGILPDALEKLALLIEKQIGLKKKVTNHLIYPAFISMSALGALLFMAVFVIPSFLEVFTEMNMQLPFLTRVMVYVSSTLRAFWYLLPVPVLGGVMLFRNAFTMAGKSLSLDKRLLSIPLLGKVLLKIAVARFVSTFGILLKSGVPVLEALTLSKGVTGNLVLDMEIDAIYSNVRAGKSIAEKMYQSVYFPQMVANMVKTGEYSGRLPETLGTVDDYYTIEIDNSLSDFLVVLEPVLILIIGVAVGLIAVGMLLPIFNLPGVV